MLGELIRSLIRLNLASEYVKDYNITEFGTIGEWDIYVRNYIMRYEL